MSERDQKIESLTVRTCGTSDNLCHFIKHKRLETTDLDHRVGHGSSVGREEDWGPRQFGPRSPGFKFQAFCKLSNNLDSIIICIRESKYFMQC